MATENGTEMIANFSGVEVNMIQEDIPYVTKSEDKDFVKEFISDIVFMYGEESPVNTIITNMYTAASDEENVPESEEDNIFGVIAIECSKRPELSDENPDTDESELTDPACKNIEEALELVAESTVLDIEDFRRIINIIYTSKQEDLITYLEDIKNNFGDNENSITVILSRIDFNQVPDIEKYMDEKTLYIPVMTKNLMFRDNVEEASYAPNILEFYGIMGNHDGLCGEDERFGTVLNDLIYSKIDMFETFKIKDACIMQNLFDGYYTLQQSFVNFAYDVVTVRNIAMDDFEASMARFFGNLNESGLIPRRLNRKSDFQYVNTLNLKEDSFMVKPYVNEITKRSKMIEAINTLIKEQGIKHIALFGHSQMANSIELPEELGDTATNHYEYIFKTVAEANPEVQLYALDHLKDNTPTEFFTDRAGYDLVLIGSNHYISVPHAEDEVEQTKEYLELARELKYPLILDLNTCVLETPTLDKDENNAESTK